MMPDITECASGKFSENGLLGKCVFSAGIVGVNLLDAGALPALRVTVC